MCSHSTKRLFSSTFFKRWRPRGVSAKNGIFFLPSFFVFGFAKQMSDVSQTRKEVPSASKEKALQRQTNLRYQDFLAAFLSQNRRKEKLTKETPSALTPRGRHYAWGGRFCKSDAKQSRKASANIVRNRSTNQNLLFNYIPTARVCQPWVSLSF